MTISEYKINKDFRAPKVNLKEHEMQSYRSYQKGAKVTGYVNETSGNKLFMVENSYVLPMSVLEFVKDIEIDGKPVNPKPEITAEQAVKNSKQKIEIPKEYREQMEKIKNTNIVGSVVNKSRNSVNGMLIGAGIGLLAAVILKQSKFLGIVIGATGGGFIGYKITGDQKKKQTEQKPETKK